MTEAAPARRPAERAPVRLAAALAALGTWRRLALAAALGALSAAALPPVHAVPVLVPAFVGLIWLLDGVRRRIGAFALGWAFGVGFFAAGLYWVGIAFMVDAATYGWMMPFAVAGLSAGLALFPALAVLATWRLGWSGPARVLGFAAFWVAAEWLRGTVLTGFPWNLMGTVWGFSDWMVQPAAWGGVWTLSLLTVFAAAAPATLSRPQPGRGRWVPSMAAAVLLVLAAAAGAWRLEAAPAPGGETWPGVHLRLVQPGIPQDLKWDRDERRRNLRKHMTLTAGPGPRQPTHVLWPETAVPFFLSRQTELRRALGNIAPADGALVTGAPRLEDGADGERRLYNSLLAIAPGGEIAARYDKFHLVPFGEYVPLRSILPVDKLTAGRVDFSAGPGPRTLRAAGLPPVSPLICYEAIFPGRVLDPGDRPAWLLNVTNDAWFGNSSGPYQHFAAARLRAVEEGAPLVRVANTGISAVVDGHGRILQQLALGRVGVIDSPLPRPLDSMPLYARLGDAVPAALVALVLVLAFALRHRA